MTIEHVLAVVPVSDIDLAKEWYERLLGREPDNHPMDSLLEWRATENGWVQVTQDAERAGTALLNLAVDDLAKTAEGLRSRGLNPSSIQDVNKGVQLSTLNDPDGNTITLIGNFRIAY